MSGDRMDERFVRRVIATMKCGVCGQRYEASDVNILGHRDDLWFLGVFCTHCRSRGLVAAMIKEGKNAEVISDLSEEEYARFLEGEEVRADDILDIHEFLKGFNGDFSKLFSE